MDGIGNGQVKPACMNCQAKCIASENMDGWSPRLPQESMWLGITLDTNETAGHKCAAYTCGDIAVNRKCQYMVVIWLMAATEATASAGNFACYTRIGKLS